MNPDSWSRLVTTFGPIVYRWCRAAGVAESDSPDVVQNVFAAVARGIGSFQRRKSRAAFGPGWRPSRETRSAIISANSPVERLRPEARKRGNCCRNSRTRWIQPSAPENARCAINRRVLESVRNEFEATTWSAFWLTAVDGKSAAEASAEVGISIASVYQAKSRVLRRLRQKLAELPE